MIKTIHELLDDLSKKGGFIVPDSVCTEVEMTSALNEDRIGVCEDGKKMVLFPMTCAFSTGMTIAKDYVIEIVEEQSA